MEKKLKRELNARLAAIQGELLAHKLSSEDASEKVEAARRVYQRQLAKAQRNPRRWYLAMLATAALAALAFAAAGYRALPPDDPALRSVYLTSIGASGVFALVLYREMRRVRRRAEDCLGVAHARLVMDAPAIDLSCREREVTALAIDVKNQAALVSALDDESLAELDGVVLDFLARHITERGGILLAQGHGDFLAVFRGDTVPDAARVATETARRIQSEIARSGASVSVQGRTAHLGMGIAAGKAQAGVVGTSGQQSFVCVGRTVELAHELAEAAGWGEVLLSEDLFTRLEGEVKAHPREPLRSLVMDSIIRIHAVVIPVEGEAA